MVPKDAILKIKCKNQSYLIFVVNMKMVVCFPQLSNHTRWSKPKAIFRTNGL